jgi:hypothetical protein
MFSKVTVKGYSSLTDQQQQLFQSVHKRHMSAFGSENKLKYALDNLREINWDRKENCLKVYYDDVWWHYDTKGDWY